MKARRVKKLDPDAPLGENAARIIRVRLDEMLSFAPKALKEDEDEAQHDMRIAAKRLRYVLEVTGFCFGRSANTARRRARDLQDILGEIHDCDVMLPQVLDHLEQMRNEDATAVRVKAGKAPDLDPRIAGQAPHRTAYRGLEVLAVYLKARRELLFERFLAYWHRQRETGTWVRLERTVEGYLKRERDSRRAEQRAAKAKAELDAAHRAEHDAAESAELAGRRFEASGPARRRRTRPAARR